MSLWRCQDVTCDCRDHARCEVCAELLPMDDRASVLDEHGYEVWACPACTVGRVVVLLPGAPGQRQSPRCRECLGYGFIPELSAFASERYCRRCDKGRAMRAQSLAGGVPPPSRGLPDSGHEKARTSPASSSPVGPASSSTALLRGETGTDGPTDG